MQTTEDGREDRTRALLEPLAAWVNTIDEAGLNPLDLLLERPGLLDRFLDPEAPAALPAALRAAAAAYLDGLPGYRAGDVARAAAQHRLRLDLWNGEAMPVGADEIEALGLEEESEHD